MNDSIWDDPRITAYVLDELDPDDRAAFEAELVQNQELATAVEEARSVADRLTTMFAEESPPRLDPDRRATLFGSPSHRSVNESASGGALPTESPGTTASRRWPWRSGAVALAIAASLLLIVGVAPQLREHRLVSWNFTEAEAPATDEMPRQLMEQAPSRRMLGRKSGSEGERASEFAAAASEFDAAASEGVTNERVEDRSAASMPATASAPASAPVAERSSRLSLGVSAGASKSSIDPIQAGDSTRSSEVAGEPFRFESELGRSVEFRAESDADADGLPAAGGLGGGYGDAVTLSERLGESQTLDESEERGEIVRGAQVRGVQPLEQLERLVKPLPSTQRQQADFYFDSTNDTGIGPGMGGDQFDPITDNPFQRVSEHPLSTFSIDVDTASYSKVRDFLLRAGRLPRADAVRIEELVNYFDYGYDAPSEGEEHPFNARVDVTDCPWNDNHRLARVAIQGKRLDLAERPRANLVFLIDTSGSMNAPNKLPLVVQGMKLLLEQLDEKDRVAIAVYAGSAGLVLDSTLVEDSARIRRALTELAAGGSTNGGAGISLAYQTARDHFIPGGVNRVILCTDGDFNVGTTGTDQLVRMVEREAQGGVFLSVLGFGMGNHNDAMLEQISGRGNGNYAFIDNDREARKVLVEQAAGTLVTIAKDVKLQLEFNPRHVSGYRLIGYENRVLAKEDFNDDKKDAGEIGAGHSVTALYELVPAGEEPDAVAPPVDSLRYQTPLAPTEAAGGDEWMMLKLRYKQPDEDESTLIEVPVADQGTAFEESGAEFRFAAAVAGFGMQLRRSPYVGSWTLSDVRSVAAGAIGADPSGRRAEFLQMIDRATQLMVQEQPERRSE